MAMNSAEKPRMTRPTRGSLFSPLIRKTARSQPKRGPRGAASACGPACDCWAESAVEFSLMGVLTGGLRAW